MATTFDSFLVVVVTVLIFFLTQFTFACKPKLSVRPVAFGHAGDQFIAITNSSEGILCLFQLPNSSVVKGKYYLSEGKPLEEAWSPLKGMLKGLDIGLVMSNPSGGHYLVLSFLDNDKFMKPLVFNIDTKELVSTGDQQMMTPSRPVSTKEPMVAYDVKMLDNGAFFARFSYDGLQPSSGSVTIVYILCGHGGGQQQQLVAKKSHGSEKCETALTPEAWDIVGFSDDTHFYFITKGIALSFEKAAIGSKLGKPVLFKQMKATELLVDGPPPNDPGDHTGGGGDGGGGGRKSKGSGSSAVVIVVVIVLLLLLCILAGVGLFCVCQRKNAQQESAKSKDGKGKGKGKGKGSKRGSSSMGKGGKKGLKTKTSGRMASSKMSKRKSSTGKMNSKRSSLRGGGKSKKRKSTSLSGRKGSSKKGSTAAASRSGKFSSKTSRKASSRKLSSGKSKSKRRPTV